MKESKLEKAISAASAQRIYDLIGKRYDWFGGYDAHAKARAFELLGVAPGQFLLEVGVGTGKEHARIYAAILPGGISFGIDISRVMLSLTHQKNKTPLCQADARNIPFVSDRFDRIYMSYVLDLLPINDIPGILAGLRRVLKPGGRIVIVALTEGITLPSRVLVAAWKAVYKLSPITCAGCRPLQLTSMLEKAGFKNIQREVVVQLAVPSEILVAIK
jgi:demethylmenaquinone methyltransferase/2-methoxy-6-polyprenyl-1,4-benzoquinol methylase